MMKKQLQKFKLGVENLSRPSKPDKNSEELLAADQKVESFKDVLEKIGKKFATNSGSGVSLPGSGSSSSGGGGVNGDGALDAASREKRCKKLHEWRLAQAMEDSLTGLPDGLLRDVLSNCARLERIIANEIVDNETRVEASVTRKLNDIMERHLNTIQKQKRTVTRLMQEKETAKYKHQAAVRVNENAAKINQLREEQEECETKLEKERDIWAAEMFDLIAEEENIANYIVNYVTAQRLYYKSALDQIEEVMQRTDGLIRESNRRIFKVPLDEHLMATDRKIAYVIEMCVCCLLERGINEEGLLRVGCANSKLRRFRAAIDANIAQVPLAVEYNDVHVIAGVMKLYLRDLPDPLLTFRLYDEFVAATRRSTEEQCKRAILNTINQLPTVNYTNLRYLTRFLSILAENSAVNKMSSQNIAIVMSPNLLWSPAVEGDAVADSATDYLQKVNSSSAVNRIVELLVADWSFFFDGEIEFYQTMRRDDLFRENNGGATTISAPMSLVVTGGGHHGVNNTTTTINGETMNHGMTTSMHASFMASDLAASANHHTTASSTAPMTSHSRSSSHDTSLILLSGHLEQTKRSQSSSSLSDASSPPGQSSPKLPVRRKHNKQAAPTPPDTRFAHNTDTFRNFDEQPPHSQSKPTAAIRRVFDSNDSLAAGGQSTGGTSRPDKPPRPTFVSTECQTLNRSQYRSAKESTSSSHPRPSALPKGMLFTNRSTENLSDKATDAATNNASNGGHISPVQLRDPMIKPAIPERPVSLMRPNNFKGSAAATTPEAQQNTGEPLLKKTPSFRGANAVGGGQLPPLNGQTTLERTHIYNVDKKQVAIIDFVDSTKATDSQTKSSTTTTMAAAAPVASIVTASLKIRTDAEPTLASEQTAGGTALVGGTVPPSPRGFDPKIKRPQIPAPPPPTSAPGVGGRPKSESGDSTQL